MKGIIDQRIAATIEGDFVVFLIGARINKWWKPHKYIPVGRAMTRMIRELQEHPELGLLHVESWTGRSPVMIQYWRSFEDLQSYAQARNSEHLPAWADFNRRIGMNGDVGIWHETYPVKAGQFEAIYGNMPLFGLAKAGGWEAATGAKRSAAGRLGIISPEDVASELLPEHVD